MGHDQVQNLILNDAKERVYSNGSPPESVELGLYVERLANAFTQMCWLVEGILCLFLHLFNLRSQYDRLRFIFDVSVVKNDIDT